MNKLQTPVHFNSVFADDLVHFIALKRSLGIKFQNAEYFAKQFDELVKGKQLQQKALTKSMVVEFCTPQAHQSPNTVKPKISFIRQFSIYLRSRKICEAWPLPRIYGGRYIQFVPYIYSQEEIFNLIKCSQYQFYKPSTPYWHLAFPLIIKILICCGLRISEVLRLRLKNLNLDENYLLILNSKNGNNRIVPFCDEIKDEFVIYLNYTDLDTSSDNYIFPYRYGQPISSGGFRTQFNHLLQTAGIPRTETGPRIHDLRHTFAVYKLKEWAERGMDLKTLLPFLKFYMGHKTFEETAYYLRLTVNSFPLIRKVMEPVAKEVFPNFDDYVFEE